MKNIAIFEKQTDSDYFDRFKNLLGDGFNCFRISEHGSLSEKPDLIAVFGGDGTILRIAPYAVENQIPIVAVNTGTVGFLSGYESKDLELCADDVKKGRLNVSERTVLKIACKGKEYLALNDAVIERDKARDGKAVVCKLSFSLDGKKIYDLSSDGVIISTPTGSTAYSLSAGGVILAPNIKSFIATPICSHSLGIRPVVFDDQSVCEIEASPKSNDCILSVDGRYAERLESGEKAIVSKNVKRLKIIDNENDFYDRVHRKLG